MKHLLFLIFLAPLFSVTGVQETKAVEINCAQASWKNSDYCEGKQIIEKVSPVRASDDDLGGADILGPDSELQEEGYKAQCGPKQKKCTVSFNDGRLTINQGRGITKDKFVSVVKSRTCRQRSIALPMVRSCFQSQYDHDYTITYKGKNGEKRAALIVFRPGYLLGNELAHESFYKDFQIWIGDVIRPIGPSLKIE